MAFPTTPILDDFNRGDVSPLDGALVQGFQPGDGEAELVSSTVRWLNHNGSQLCGYVDSTVRTDCEAYLDITTIVAGSWHSVLLRVANADASNCRGYEVVARTDSQDLRVYRWDDEGTVTPLGSFISQTVASGDKVGASVAGDTITIYYKSGAGAWTLIDTRTDSTYATGKIGFRLGVNAGSFADNFGGGNISSNAYTLTAETGTFTLTGENAALKAGRKLTAGLGSFTLSGQDASFARTRVMVAETAHFTLTGFAAAFSGQLTAPRSVAIVSRETRTLPVSEDSRVH